MTVQGLATRILALVVGVGVLVVAAVGLDHYATKRVSDVGAGSVYGPFTTGRGSTESYGLHIKAEHKSGAETSEDPANAALYHLLEARGGAHKTLPVQVYYDSGSDEVARVVYAGQPYQIDQSSSSALAVGITLAVIGLVVTLLAGVALVRGARRGMV